MKTLAEEMHDEEIRNRIRLLRQAHAKEGSVSMERASEMCREVEKELNS